MSDIHSVAQMCYGIRPIMDMPIKLGLVYSRLLYCSARAVYFSFDSFVTGGETLPFTSSEAGGRTKISSRENVGISHHFSVSPRHR